MKLSDDSYDEDNNLYLAIVFGLLCALTSAIATVLSSGAAYIFIGILIGNILVFKVDGIHHIITGLIFVLICLICGIPNLNLVVLLIVILAVMSDEVGHELIANYTENNFLILFFEYRFVLKIVTFLLALCGAFSFEIFIFFILFELFYVIGGLVLKRD
jgi:hypothetical protein